LTVLKKRSRLLKSKAQEAKQKRHGYSLKQSNQFAQQTIQVQMQADAEKQKSNCRR
jgi:hypothetical protein